MNNVVRVSAREAIEELEAILAELGEAVEVAP